jgi:hypothetical protein
MKMKPFVKITTKAYIPLWVRLDYSSYDDEFRRIRSSFAYKCSECFKCGHSFVPDQPIAIACFKGVGNKVLCNPCAKGLLDQPES